MNRLLVVIIVVVIGGNFLTHVEMVLLLLCLIGRGVGGRGGQMGKDGFLEQGGMCGHGTILVTGTDKGKCDHVVVLIESGGLITCVVEVFFVLCWSVIEN